MDSARQLAVTAETGINRLLSTLGQKDRKHVLAACDVVELAFGDVLCEPGQRIPQVYFPIDSSISQLVVVRDHDDVEVALVGNEGMLGAALVLGVKTTHLQAVVHGAGSALRMRPATLYRELKLVPALYPLLFRYVWVLQAQLAQSLSCTSCHALDRRLAGRLLAAQDRMGENSFHLTQKLLGQLLGVRRVGISNAAGLFQERQLIRYSRGMITILDRPGLRKATCGCYQIARDVYDGILG